MYVCVCARTPVYRLHWKHVHCLSLFCRKTRERWWRFSRSSKKTRAPCWRERKWRFTRWRCCLRIWYNKQRGLAKSKGSPHTVQLMNGCFECQSSIFRGAWLFGVVTMKDVRPDSTPAAQFLTRQIVSADIQLSFARLIRFKDASDQISGSSLGCVRLRDAGSLLSSLSFCKTVLS